MIHNQIHKPLPRPDRCAGTFVGLFLYSFLCYTYFENKPLKPRFGAVSRPPSVADAASPSGRREPVLPGEPERGYGGRLWRIIAPYGARPLASTKKKRAALLRSSPLRTARKRRWLFWSRCGQPTARPGTMSMPTVCGRATGSATPMTVNRPRRRGPRRWKYYSTAD